LYITQNSYICEYYRVTSRFFIIRGCFILSWFGYQFMSDMLINQNIRLKLDFMLVFGLVSLGMGLILTLTKENLAKLEASFILSVIGLFLGIWGVVNSFPAFARLLQNDFYFALKATTLLFFGLLITFLYLKSVKELIGKIAIKIK